MNHVEYLPTLLDGVTLPTDDLNAELLKSVIMERCGLLEPLYSEPETMKEVISIWFRSHSWNIERIINLIKTEYSPLENYDRHEDLERGKSDTRNRSETRTQEYSENGDVTTNQEAERTVAAFNTSTYAPADKTVTDTRTQTETTGDTSGSTTGTEAGSEAEHAINYIHGNIGVTTSQQMFLAELDLLGGFNAYQFITEKFSEDLMLSIW